MGNFQDIKPLTLKWEGGLSRATTDTASKNPSPYIHNGVSGWHTNKGITYQTFKAAANKYGFVNNAENFINMPDAIWDKIAKGLFWNDLNLDNVKSNGVAFQLFSWHWGAGRGWFPRMQRYLTSKGVNWDKKSSTLSGAINQVIDKQGEKQTISDLDTQQQEFYTSLNQPANIKGWINRIKETTSYAYSFLGRVYSENKKTINYSLLGLGIILISITTFYYFKKK
jgi:lysozyme family protein